MIEYEIPVVTDWDSIQRLLCEADLPSEGIEQQLENFTIARDIASGDIVGVAGLEVYRNIGLLRSLVVAPGFRRKGIAATLVGKSISDAKQRELGELYLITETAVDWFRHLGFQECSRNNLPQAILSCSLLSRFCPQSATVMKMELP